MWQYFFFLRLVTLELNHYPLVQEKAVDSAEPVNGQKELNYVRGEESIEEEPCRLSFGRVICDLDLELSEEEPCRVKFRQSYLWFGFRVIFWESLKKKC
jgi:hypothetical protein